VRGRPDVPAPDLSLTGPAVTSAVLTTHRAQGDNRPARVITDDLLSRLWRPVTLVALHAALIAGCGGDGAVPLSQLPTRLATAQCERVFRCCALVQIQRIYGSSVTDQATCIDMLTRVGNLLVSGVTDAQNAGRLRYNGVTAAVCFQKLGTAVCTAASNDSSVVPECDAYLEPLVSVGGACGADQECHTGFCDRPTAGTGDGACAEIPTNGMRCTSRCAPGSYCDSVRTMCAAPKTDGSFCITDEECQSGTCDNPSLTGGSCVPAPAATCGMPP
jgi:hypothetical protein